jgi:thiol-disulfide isomerase/thioredoxin
MDSRTGLVIPSVALLPLLLFFLLSPLFLLAVGCSPAYASEAGVQWRDLTLEQALAEAKEKDTMVLVDVWAGHCHSCGQMDIDLWDTPEGAKLAEKYIPIKIESVSATGREFSDRYPITGLPSIILLRPDGTELDRVEGYYEKRKFLRDFQPLLDGTDPLLVMEAHMAARPDSLDLVYEIFEKYLNRRREAEADTLFNRLLQKGGVRYADKAIVRMARYQEYVRHDYPKTLEYYKMLVEQYPSASSAGGAINGAFKTMVNMGKGDEWPDWICGVLEKNPQEGYLQRSAAMTAFQGGYRGHCFAEAARRAIALGVGKSAYMDSIAVILAADSTKAGESTKTGESPNGSQSTKESQKDDQKTKDDQQKKPDQKQP